MVNTINKLHIRSDLDFINKKTSIMINKIKWIPFLIEYHVSLLDYLDHPALIEEQEQNIDADAY